MSARIALAFLTISAFTTLAAAPDERRAMLEAFDAALTALAYAAAGMCAFCIVWAAFALMGESTEERGDGKARGALFGAIAGLVLTLSAKGVSYALLEGIVPIPFP